MAHKRQVHKRLTVIITTQSHMCKLTGHSRC